MPGEPPEIPPKMQKVLRGIERRRNAHAGTCRFEFTHSHRKLIEQLILRHGPDTLTPEHQGQERALSGIQFLTGEKGRKDSRPDRS